MKKLTLKQVAPVLVATAMAQAVVVYKMVSWDHDSSPTDSLVFLAATLLPVIIFRPVFTIPGFKSLPAAVLTFCFTISFAIYKFINYILPLCITSEEELGRNEIRSRVNDLHRVVPAYSYGKNTEWQFQKIEKGTV